jgi:hypothetical protein
MCEDNYGTIARFVVKQKIDAETIKVCFFDFGDTDVRNVSQCRPLPLHLVQVILL